MNITKILIIAIICFAVGVFAGMKFEDYRIARSIQNAAKSLFQEFK